MGYLDRSDTWDAVATADYNQDIAYTDTAGVNSDAFPVGEGVVLEIVTTTDAYFVQVAAGGAATSAGRRIASYTPTYIRSRTGFVSFIRRSTSGTAWVSTVKLG